MTTPLNGMPRRTRYHWFTKRCGCKFMYRPRHRMVVRYGSCKHERGERS